MLKLVKAGDVPAARVDPRVAEACAQVSAERLVADVRALAFPRSMGRDTAANQRAAAWTFERLRGLGWQVERHGASENIVARPPGFAGACTLVGAHYDSVPGTPGADDNASGVAAVLEAARLLDGAPAVALAFWNGEEDGLVGSREMAATGVPGLRFDAVHVLEMVGYCRHEPGSQAVPPGLPIALPDRGDFLGLLANHISQAPLDTVLRAARTYVPGLPVLGLPIPMGLERLLPVLQRSDHAPFWATGVPAVMWTDTSEFRNPNYHRPSDTPETLDDQYLRSVTQLLVATLLG